MTDAITLTPIIPPAPYILGDSKFVATLADVEQRVESLAVTDAATAQIAADLQIRLTTAGRTLEDCRAYLIRPLLDAQKLINNTAKPISDRIEGAKGRVKSALASFHAEQQRLADEAEKARRAELERLERLRQAEEAEAKRKADEIAQAAAKAEAERLAKLTADQKAKEAELDFEEEPLPPEPAPKTATELAIEQVKHTPAPVIAKPAGITYRVTLRIASIDPAKLPDVFIERRPKEQAIRAAFCTGWKEGAPIPECSGVAFEIDRQAVSTGRAAF